jgi:AraC-like DNA-binding protein
VAIPVFIYVIGYFSLKQPELFRIKEETEKNTFKKKRLPEPEALLLQKKLDSLMVNEKIFLQNDLTLADVSEMLQTSTNNVSWLLNQVYKTTFYDFINRYRVHEFVKKVENKEHLKHTILALSMDVGFNSKSTFNKAFKETMRDTPSNYIKKHRAA